MKFSTCYTHKQCADGKACSWIVKRCNPQCKIIPISHKEPFKYHEGGGNVIFTDFCPEVNLLPRLLELYESVVIIDHHPIKQSMPVNERIIFVHDMQHAACQLVWQFFYPDLKMPWFINYISDRDRYVFELDDSKLINYGLYECNKLWYGGFEDLLHESEISMELTLKKYKEIGGMYEGKQHNIVMGEINKAYPAIFIVKKDYQLPKIKCTYNIMITECASYLFTEVSAKILENHPEIDFVASYYYHLPNSMWSISMRALENKVNLSELCKNFNDTEGNSSGGGHAGAASLSIFVNGKDSRLSHSIHDVIVLPDATL